MAENFSENMIGGMNVQEPDECIVCGNFRFNGWNVMHGECTCVCGAVYQIRPLSNQEWEDIPYHKIDEDWLPACHAMYEQEGSFRGLEEWVQDHPEYDPRTE